MWLLFPDSCQEKRHNHSQSSISYICKLFLIVKALAVLESVPYLHLCCVYIVTFQLTE